MYICKSRILLILYFTYELFTGPIVILSSIYFSFDEVGDLFVDSIVDKKAVHFPIPYPPRR